MFLPCRPCCGDFCGPGTDPKDEGTWVPSGVWPNVSWSFVPNPGDESGETWFFYGSENSSSLNGPATVEEQQDWGNPCNWWSVKSTAPNITSSIAVNLRDRASRFPPSSAVVHFYSSVTTSRVGPQTIKAGYFWSGAVTVIGPVASLIGNSTLTATGTVYGLSTGTRFSNSNSSFLAGNTEESTINGGATFVGYTTNTSNSVVDGGAVFDFNALNSGTVNGGADFFNGGKNYGTINGGALFDGSIGFAPVNYGIINDGADFIASINWDYATVNGGATFSDFSRNFENGLVNGGAVFNDTSCSRRTVGNFYDTPCSRKFVAHPTDIPTCNGTAPAGCDNVADTCGCG
jgi:hypothetical protein